MILHITFFITILYREKKNAEFQPVLQLSSLEKKNKTKQKDNETFN